MTDYQTKQRQRNMVVGAFVIIALCLFVWMLLRFRELPLFVSRVRSFNVLVFFPEVPGVQKDTPVKYCGYQIGRVMKISTPKLQGESHKVGVTVAIEKKYNDIPDDVQFMVIKRGLGSSYIEIRDLSEKEPTDFLKDQMVLEGSIGVASDFFPPEVQDKMEDLVDSITALSENANAIIGDGQNQTNIKKAIASIEAAFSQATETMQSIQQLSDTGTKNVKVLGDKIITLAEQMEAVLSESRQIMAKIDSGQGTMGKMVNDGRLYEDLLESSQELRMMLEQIKELASEARQEGVKVKL